MKQLSLYIKLSAICLLVIFSCFSFNSPVVYATETNDINSAETENTSKNDVPVVEITGYRLEDGVLKAGKDTTFILNIHNASKSSEIRNLVINFTSLTKAVLPAYGSNNQAYIDRIKPDETMEISLPITLMTGYEGDYADLQCEFSYQVKSTTIRNTIVVAVPTMGSSIVDVRSIEVSPHATVGSKTLLCINLMNHATSNITDACLVVKGNVSSDSKVIKMGTLYAGKGYSEDCQITLTELGAQEIGITLKYTDSNGGKVETDLGTFSINVEEEEVKEDDDGTLQISFKLFGVLLAAAGVAAAAYVAFQYVMKR